VGSFNEHTFQSPKEAMYDGMPRDQQYAHGLVQPIHSSQGMGLQPEMTMQGQMANPNMMYKQQGMPGPQMPFTEPQNMPMPGMVGGQPIPMESQENQQSVYNQFQNMVAPQDQGMPPMPPMPAMPTGVASLEQIEARMRDEPKIADPAEQMAHEPAQEPLPEPPQKFWGDLPESNVSMADIMNEETEKAKEAMKLVKTRVVHHAEIPMEPQADIISAGKSNWAEQPSHGPVKPKSLAEIQAEEEKLRALNKVGRSDQHVSDNSWAAKLGGNNAYPSPSISPSAVDNSGVHHCEADSNDGFEAVTTRKNKKKSGQQVTAIQRDVRFAPSPNAPNLNQIQAEETERRKLASGVSRQVVDSSADDDMFWEMSSEPQQQRSNVPLGNPWGSSNKHSAPTTMANTTSSASFPSLSNQLDSSSKGRSTSKKNNASNKVAFNPSNSKPMSDGFTSWCKEQMRQLNGSDDMTLVEFLMSLHSEKEIREYVEFYLGKSAKSSKFTTEFMFRMEAETKTTLAKDGGAFENVNPSKAASGNRKKGKKKGKKLDASLLGFNTGIHLYSDSLEVE